MRPVCGPDALGEGAKGVNAAVKRVAASTASCNRRACRVARDSRGRGDKGSGIVVGNRLPSHGQGLLRLRHAELSRG